MMRMLIAFISSVLKHFEKNRQVLINFILVLLIFGCEEAVARFAFKCPCSLLEDDREGVPDMRLAYSALFIGVPAFVFWILGMVLQDNTWRCLTGWRVQPKFRYPGRSCACFFGTIFGSAIAPVTWFMFALLDGRYLDCGMSAVPHTCRHLVTGEADAGKYSDDSADVRLKSQMAGLCLAGVLLLFYFILMLLVRCCSSVPYYELEFASRVQQIEQQSFEAAVQEELEEQFKRKWRALIRNGTKDDWIDVSEMKGSGPVSDGKQWYYSPFHEWQSKVILPPGLNVTFSKDPVSRGPLSESAVPRRGPHYSSLDTPRRDHAQDKPTPRMDDVQGTPRKDQPSPGRQLPTRPQVYGEVYHLEPMRNNSAYLPKSRVSSSPLPPASEVDDEYQDGSHLMDMTVAKKKKRKKRAKKSQVRDIDV